MLDTGQVVADGPTREVLADEGFMRAHRLELPAGFNPLVVMSLFIVGLGPGGPEHRTAAAERAVREADVVIGYGPYVDQCADLLDEPGSGARARWARSSSARGKRSSALADARVALVSRGDAGVHGMAARTLAMAEGIDVTVIPGVTAALATAAALGAPLADDWATLSLSDLHLPLETVERRLTGLAAVGHRARALQPALEDAHRAVRPRPGDPARAPRRRHARGGRDRRRPRGRALEHDDARRRSTRRR